ncbi:MAG: hypothetical protein ABSF98_20820 [Bryobacteraceae bacterium]
MPIELTADPRTGAGARLRKTRWAVLALAFTASAAAATPDSNAIMGFETPAGWMARGVFTTTATSTTTRTQGASALAVKDGFLLTTLTSLPVASTATALTGIGTSGATFEVDVQPPPVRDNDFDDRFEGSMLLLISCPSRRLPAEVVGTVDLRTLRSGTYNTVKFPIAKSIQSALAGASFNDLTFQFALSWQLTNVGKLYLFDNLRVNSAPVVTATASTKPPPGYGGSVTLDAYGGSGSPGSQTFPIGPIQVPEDFHLKQGTAGAGSSVKLELGLDGTPSFTCTYLPDPTDTTDRSYVFSSCTGGTHPGDLVSSNWVLLAIVNGNSSMRVRAQLAANPMGSQLGSGLLPPMPTFWGDFDTCVPAPHAGTFLTASPSCTNQLAEANKIVTAYFNKVQNANVAPNWIVTPAPDYATHQGIGAPVSLLPVGGGGGSSGSTTTFPFNQSGHINQGGSFDAYWELSGNLTDALPLGTDQATTSVDARFGTHVVLFGDDADIFDIEAALSTATAESYPVVQGPIATGLITSYFGGEQFPTDCCSFNAGTINLSPSHEKDFDLPPISIWIFDVTTGLTVTGGFNLTGTVQPNDLNVVFTPSVAVGAHVQGSISIIVASGGLDVNVALAAVQAPMTANLAWTFSEDPATCAAKTSGDFNQQLTLSSGGGEVDLVATFGICPLCHDESYTLFKWDPIVSHTWTLFDDPLTGTHPLPVSDCTKPLSVTIESPAAAGATFPTGLPVSLSGVAFVQGGSEVPCGDLTWTFTPTSALLPPVTGCTPTVTFPTPSGTSATWTVNLSAAESFANSGGTITETGSATPVQVTVTTLSGGVYVTQLTDSDNNVYPLCTPACSNNLSILVGVNDIRTYVIQGLVNGGAGTLSTTFTVTDVSNNTTTLTTTNPASSTPSAAWTPTVYTVGTPPFTSQEQTGTYTITMTTTANGSPFASTVTTVNLFILE